MQCNSYDTSIQGAAKKCNLEACRWSPRRKARLQAKQSMARRTVANKPRCDHDEKQIKPGVRGASRFDLALLVIWNCKPLGATLFSSRVFFLGRGPWCSRPGRADRPLQSGQSVRGWPRSESAPGPARRRSGGPPTESISPTAQLGRFPRWFSASQRATWYTDTLEMPLVISLAQSMIHQRHFSKAFEAKILDMSHVPWRQYPPPGRLSRRGPG